MAIHGTLISEQVNLVASLWAHSRDWRLDGDYWRSGVFHLCGLGLDSLCGTVRRLRIGSLLSLVLAAFAPGRLCVCSDMSASGMLT